MIASEPEIRAVLRAMGREWLAPQQIAHAAGLDTFVTGAAVAVLFRRGLVESRDEEACGVRVPVFRVVWREPSARGR
jgi:hypothetical protein